MPTKLLDVVHRRVADAVTATETTLTAVGGDPAGPRDDDNLPGPMVAYMGVLSADAQYGRLTGPQIDPSGIYSVGRTATLNAPILDYVGEALEDDADLVLAGLQDAGAGQDVDGATVFSYEAPDGPEMPSLGDQKVGVVGGRVTTAAAVADTWVSTAAATAFPDSITRRKTEYWLIDAVVIGASLVDARLGVRSHSHGTRAPLPYSSDVALQGRIIPKAPWVDDRVRGIVGNLPQPYYFGGGNRPTIEHLAIAGTATSVFVWRAVYRDS